MPIRIYSILVIFFTYTSLVLAQNDCDPVFDPPLSERIANYKMNVRLDTESKTLSGTEQLEWTNVSELPVRELRFYMYVNAFRNSSSSWIQSSSSRSFGLSMTERKAEEWGWIEVHKIVDSDGSDLSGQTQYIQPDDQNEKDHTVLQVKLNSPIQPGETRVFDIDFSTKFPKLFVRTGYGKKDYYHIVHWYPKIGVWEQDTDSTWNWNCHQFFAGTEFFGEFGTYDFTITTPKHLTVGASGCRTSQQINQDGTMSHRFKAEDVIDFACVVYSEFEVFKEQWNHVSIKLHLPYEHVYLKERYLKAATSALEYLDKYLGKYPYPTLTIVDPPMHSLRSGLMEYPTYITGASFYGVPTNVRTPEILTVHEFTHQYFMGMLASNEKEEPWLDEGLVSYWEDRIMDHYYGEKTAYFDVCGYRTGDKELSRLRYTTMPNPNVGITARPGWEIRTGYKGLVYSKPATWLHTLENMVGRATTDRAFQTYFERFKFKHPRGEDFLSVMNEIIQEDHGDRFGENMNWFFDQVLYTNSSVDYAVTDFNSYRSVKTFGLKGDDHEYQSVKEAGDYTNRVNVERRGALIIPVEVLFTFEDGTTELIKWDASESRKEFVFQSESKLICAHIDPEQKIYMDLDLNNNSYTVKPASLGIWKYAIKTLFWMQQLFQTVNFLC